jgi:hypothetical protein
VHFFHRRLNVKRITHREQHGSCALILFPHHSSHLPVQSAAINEKNITTYHHYHSQSLCGTLPTNRKVSHHSSRFEVTMQRGIPPSHPKHGPIPIDSVSMYHYEHLRVSLTHTNQGTHPAQMRIKIPQYPNDHSLPYPFLPSSMCLLPIALQSRH